MNLIDVDRAPETALNRICAYFTMFPLRFPHRILKRARDGDRVLDPFCGRGTTNYAARLAGLDSLGIDASPVAAAIASAKVSSTTPRAVMRAYDEVLEAVPYSETPDSEFWRWAFAPGTLRTICRLRTGLLGDHRTNARVALQAVLLGALHGPQWKAPSHLSNQAPRTFAPKPNYAISFWKTRGMKPIERDVRTLVETRVNRYFGSERAVSRGRIILGDSRTLSVRRHGAFDWIITSPPYYGMRTYMPDQWMRYWFLGGPDHTDYSTEGQLEHRTPGGFAEQLRQVWMRAAEAANDGARMIVRFGGINARRADPLDIIKESLARTPWRIATVRNAGSASSGHRQALAFSARQAEARSEYDVWAHIT